jgi:transcriptional regulator with XRE-family HTH domain
MGQKTAALLPATDDLLQQFGERLRVARLRRRLTAKQLAERAGMAPMTLRSLERGGSGVTMGAYLAVMQVLGIETDLNLLGKADPVGRDLQDAQLPARAKAAKTTRLPAAKQVPKPAPDTPDWMKSGDFASADTLVGLIDPMAPPKAKVRKAG